MSKKLVRELSDHNALLHNSGDVQPVRTGSRGFKFDLDWLKHENFLPLVAKFWSKHVNSVDPIDILNVKLKRVKKYLKGWGSNLHGHNRKKKRWGCN